MKRLIASLICLAFLLSLTSASFGKPSRLTAKQEKNAESLFPISVNDKWGYINRNGKVVIKPQFPPSKGYGFGSRFDRKFSDGLAKASLRGKWGFINTSGKWAIPPRFDAAQSFSEGLALVKAKKRWGSINQTGKFVIRPQFLFLWDHPDVEMAGLYDLIIMDGFTEGLAPVKIHDLCGFIDKSGRLAIDPSFDDCHSFSEGLAVISIRVNVGDPLKPGNVSETFKYGYIDKTGKMRIKPSLDEAADFSEGLAAVKIGGKVGYINKTGKLVIDLGKNQGIVSDGQFSEGLASIQKGRQAGFINHTGKMVIAPRFSYIGAFSEGMAAAFVGQINQKGAANGKWGFIDKKGKLVIKPQFARVEPFSHGLAVVYNWGPTEGEKFGYIDKSGKYVWKPTK